MNKPPPVKVNQDNLGDFPTPPTTSNTRSLSPDTKTDLSIINNPDLNLSSSNNPISDILSPLNLKKIHIILNITRKIIYLEIQLEPLNYRALVKKMNLA